MKFICHPKSKNVPFLKRTTVWMAFLVLATICIFTYSRTAHAGLLSYLSSVLGSEQASAKTDHTPTSSNSQTIALLQPATNHDPNPEKNSGLSPVLENVLVAEIAMAETIGGGDTGNTQISSYTVRSGDTISEIAEMFHVSVNTIMWANGINKGSSIREGDTLIILPVTGINYVIKKGDTIKQIATTYGADVDEILQYNNLSLSSTLIAGQKILIPDAEIKSSVPVVTSSKIANTAGYYTRPLKIGVRSQGIHGHNGVDLAAPVGTPIYASASGKVIASSANGGWNGGYGNFVIISHPNGTQTLYAHNSKNFVVVGDQVNQGDKIALIGLTGKTTGAHVHFEIRGAKNPF